jgi:hypothetical protein
VWLLLLLLLLRVLQLCLLLHSRQGWQQPVQLGAVGHCCRSRCNQCCCISRVDASKQPAQLLLLLLHGTAARCLGSCKGPLWLRRAVGVCCWWWSGFSSFQRPCCAKGFRDEVGPCAQQRRQLEAWEAAAAVRLCCLTVSGGVMQLLLVCGMMPCVSLRRVCAGWGSEQGQFKVSSR